MSVFGSRGLTVGADEPLLRLRPIFITVITRRGTHQTHFMVASPKWCQDWLKQQQSMSWSQESQFVGFLLIGGDTKKEIFFLCSSHCSPISISLLEHFLYGEHLHRCWHPFSTEVSHWIGNLPALIRLPPSPCHPFSWKNFSTAKPGRLWWDGKYIEEGHIIDIWSISEAEVLMQEFLSFVGYLGLMGPAQSKINRRYNKSRCFCPSQCFCQWTFPCQRFSLSELDKHCLWCNRISV